MLKKSLIFCFVCVFLSDIFAISRVESICDLKKILDLTDAIVTSKATRQDLGNVLFVFGLNNTLILDTDYFVRFCFEDRLVMALKAACLRLGDSYNQEYLLSKIMREASDNVSLVDKRFTDLLGILRRNGMKSLVLTNSIFEKYGVINSFADFKINQIERLGLDFSGFWFNSKNILEDCLDGKIGRVLFRRGHLFTGGFSIGEALTGFFDVLKWHPEMIVFVNDSKTEIKDVKRCMESLYKQLDAELVFCGFNFFAAKKMEGDCDMSLINYQILKFLRTGIWITESAAKGYFGITGSRFSKPLDESRSSVCTIS